MWTSQNLNEKVEVTHWLNEILACLHNKHNGQLKCAWIDPLLKIKMFYNQMGVYKIIGQHQTDHSKLHFNQATSIMW